MAVLEKLRNKAGILLAIIIGLALFGFILQDLFSSGSTLLRSTQMEIGRIGRHSISYQDYQKKIDDMVRIYQITGNSNMDEATQENLREQTWQRMVREEILSKEYDKLGINVSSDELFDLIQGSNPHPIIQQIFTDPETGIFNRTALFQFLRNMDRDQNQKAYWLFLESEISDERKFTKYSNLVGKGLYVSNAQAEMESEQNMKSVDFEYIVKRFSSIPDSLIELRSEDLKKYYETHQKDFEQDASCDIEYVVYEVKPSNSDIRAVEKWIGNIKPEFEEVEEVEQFINLNSDEPFVKRNYKEGELPDSLNDFMFNSKPGAVFGPYLEDEAYKLARLMDIQYLPDSVKARHILIIPDQTMPASDALAEANSLADSLMNLIKKGGDFASLAKEYSADQGSALLGGNLGWFNEGTMVEEFNDACFTGKPGELSKVETSYGVHLIEVQEQSKKVKKVQVGILARNLDASSETYQNVYTEASRFASNNHSYEKFNQTTEEGTISKRVASDIRQDDKIIPGLDSPRPLIRSAFKTDVGKIIVDENNQAVFEMEDKFVVAYVAGKREEGIASLASRKSEIAYNVRKEKKAEIIEKEFLEKMKNAGSLEDLSASLDLTVEEANGINFSSFSIPRAGLEPTVIAAAVQLSEGELSAPVKGNNGVFVLRVNNVVETAGTDAEVYKNQISATYQTRTSYEIYEALKESTGVKDLRSKFY